MKNAVNVKACRKCHIVKTSNCRDFSIKSNILVLVLIFFIIIASIQALELENLLSEAKTVGKDIGTVRAGQEILLGEYSSYNNNLSYYLIN